MVILFFQTKKQMHKKLLIVSFFSFSPPKNPPRTDRQPQDLAFCLNLLNMSEKCIRRLQENFACFADKLHDTEVYSSFSSILSKAKKFAKPEMKVR